MVDDDMNYLVKAIFYIFVFLSYCIFLNFCVFLCYCVFLCIFVFFVLLSSCLNVYFCIFCLNVLFCHLCIAFGIIGISSKNDQKMKFRGRGVGHCPIRSFYLFLWQCSLLGLNLPLSPNKGSLSCFVEWKDESTWVHPWTKEVGMFQIWSDYEVV